MLGPLVAFCGRLMTRSSSSTSTSPTQRPPQLLPALPHYSRAGTATLAFLHAGPTRKATFSQPTLWRRSGRFPLFPLFLQHLHLPRASTHRTRRRPARLRPSTILSSAVGTIHNNNLPRGELTTVIFDATLLQRVFTDALLDLAHSSGQASK